MTQGQTSSMKLAVLLTLTVAVTLVSSASIEKRDDQDCPVSKRFLLDTLEWLGGVASDVYDSARDHWNTLRKNIIDYDIMDRLSVLWTRIGGRIDGFNDRVEKGRFTIIVQTIRGVIEDTSEVLGVRDVVDRVRKALGRQVDDLSEDDLEKIVTAVEDDVAGESETQDVATDGGEAGAADADAADADAADADAADADAADADAADADAADADADAADVVATDADAADADAADVVATDADAADADAADADATDADAADVVAVDADAADADVEPVEVA